MENFKRKFYTWTTGHRKTVISVFLILTVICAIMWRQVGVNYDIKDYLPEDSPSTVAIQVMEREYSEGVPNARVMIKDVSIPEALEYKEKLAAVDGVDGVTWLDDSVSTAVPLETIDADLAEQYYKDGNALFSLTIDKDKILTTVPEVREIVTEEAAMTGDAISTEVATVSTVKEIALVAIMAVAVVLMLLILATESWIEPLLVLGSLGIAILLNAGTNLIFGTVSFVTNGAGNVLLLAVSLDYSVFLLHRFHEYKEETADTRQAMIDALCRSTGSIMSSGLTTVIGFLALVLMRFLLGPDLGMALAKGVFISLITVFVFLPALILSAHKLIEKTRHRDLMPDFTWLGRLVTKIMIPMVCIFVLVIAPSFMASNANDYWYGASKIFDSDTKVGRDMDDIQDVFGESDSYALMVPKGDLASEKAVSKELQQLEEVSGIISYVDTVGAEIPVEYLSEDIISQLNSDDCTRMVINVEAASEGEETFNLIEEIRAIAEKYYPGTYYLAGSGPSYYDLMDTISADMLKVNLVAIAAVYLVLALMLRSVLLPVLLVACIETAIWINLSVPYFAGTTVFYISYLIISSIQLGATVDYAILMTDRYRECRETLNKKDAVVETIASSVPSILVSGLALTTAGLLMGKFSSHGILAMLGVFLGRGALLSLFIVVFVLPGLLYLFDKLYINRGKGKMNKKKITAAVTACVMLGAVMMPVSAHAAENAKEEVIYGNLAHDGSVTSVYAVNIFDDSQVSDYGSYTSVKNLTTSDEIKVDGEKVSVEASEVPFYYEGTLENQELPWDIDIEYSLDGKKCEAQDLAGKSGALEIHMTAKEGAQSFFYENYALQISMTLDSTFCRNIAAEGATAANVGSDKQLTYTVLPGKGADITVTADVTAFEMSEISINGIKLEMDVDVDTSELESKAAEIENATVELDDGAAAVSDGASALNEAAGTLGEGAGTIDESVGTLQTGAASLDDGAGQLQAGVQELNDGAGQLQSGAGELDSSVATMQSGVTAIDEGAEALETGISQFSGGLNELYAGAKALVEGVSGDAYKAVLQANGLDASVLLQGNQQVAQQLTTMLEQAGAAMDPQQQALYKQLITLLEGNSAAINGAITYLDGVNTQLVALETGVKTLNENTASLQEGAASLSQGIGELSGGMDQLKTGTSALSQGAAELQSGTSSLATGAGELKSGTSSLTAGAAALKSGTESLTAGTSQLHSGTSALAEGTSELKEGTSTFREEASGIGEQVTNEINSLKDSITGSDEVRSFISDKNTNVESVQFVLKTEAIEIPEVEQVQEEEPELGFFEKLLNLFK